jgi:hypothetical protein
MVTPGRIGLALRTIRHLHASQVAWRLVRRLQPRVKARGGPAAFRPHLSAISAELGRQADDSLADVRRRECAERFSLGEFEALGISQSLSTVKWSHRQNSHLWSYHLHYFDVIPALLGLHRRGSTTALTTLLTAIDGWIRDTGDGRSDGWDPYPTSVRIINWLHLLVVAGHDIDDELRQRIEFSLVRQLRHLSSRLEWHLLGNHLLKNLTALVWGGVILDGPEARRWRDQGLALLEHHLLAQVLADGTHEEATPSYHSLILSDLLATIALMRAAQIPVPASMVHIAGRMREAGQRLVRSDGTFHLIGDSGDPGACWDHTTRLATRVIGGKKASAVREWSLPDSGFWGASRGGARIFIDCGPFGPDHQPGHGHCDMLSFELELDGEPVIVDSGVHGYAGDPFREYSRSTRAHNTVMIADMEQSEVWETFRVARRAVAEKPRVASSEQEYRFEGAYRPYHLNQSRHLRSFALQSGGVWIEDRVEGAPGAALSSYLHIHPTWSVRLEGHRACVEKGERRLQIEWFGVDEVSTVRGSVQPVQGWYLPAMGEAHPAFVLIARISTNRGVPFGAKVSFAGMPGTGQE